MLCPKCETRIKITHTFSSPEFGRVQSAKCSECKTRYTITSVIEEAEKRGKGAYAKIKKLSSKEDQTSEES